MKEKLSSTLSKISKPTMALAALLVVGAGFGAAALASADSTATTSTPAPSAMHKEPGVHGKVTAISGDIFTVTATNKKTSAVTTYTVDATNAKIMKSSATASTSGSNVAPAAPTAVSISDVAVGDTVSVRGTLSGTDVTATDIMDGVMPWRKGGPGGPGGQGGHGAQGTITAINGSTVTIAGKDGKTYTVDASSAKLEKISTISVSDLAVGDTIGAQGTVSGTSVAATNIMDGAFPQGSH